MASQIKHFSLHRVAGTELQVISDVESGVLPLIQVEEAIIREYARQTPWPHSGVTLFVLQNLAPLTRQLEQQQRSWVETFDALDDRPVTNVYDLGDLSRCHVFINRQAMIRAEYWDDLEAARGLLAHEHAHPLSECQTVQSSRHLRIERTREVAVEAGAAHQEGHSPDTLLLPRIDQLVYQLVARVCLYGPREVLANERAIRSGFGEALLYLDRHGVYRLVRGLAGRHELVGDLRRQVAEKTLAPAMADLLLLLGDLSGYLEQALEVSAFYRANHRNQARELETWLEREVFVHLEPEFRAAYSDLVGRYLELGEDMAAQVLCDWGTRTLAVLLQALAHKGLSLQYHLSNA